MALLRSSTAVRSPRQNGNPIPTPHGLRMRSSSFTASTRQNADQLFPPPTPSKSTQQKRRPSFESRSAGQSSNLTAHSNATTGSLLTVEDVHPSNASSIDTLGSDDEDHGHLSIPEPPSPSPSSPPVIAPSPKASVSRSISSAFKDRLHITRKKSKFSLRGKSIGSHSTPVLYDDGTQATYPPQQQKSCRSTERDQYGFIKGSQWVSVEEQDNFEKSYQPIVNRRLQKWRRLIAEYGGEWPPPSSKFKRFIRKGIPGELRGQAWFHYSGGQARSLANPGVYRGYVERAEAMGLDNEFLDIIERDLHRTFPDNIRFKSAPTANGEGSRRNDVPAIQSLRRVLSAFSLYAPEIGYCQSLNYIAGLLLLFMDEEDAFWTFVVLVQDILPPNIYDVTMEGANIDQTVLMMLLSERCPHIWNRMSSGKSFWDCEEADGGMPTTTLVTSHWFLTLFINILPIESVLRVWDCLFYEGQRALFRVALAIFKMNEREVLAVDDSLEIFQVVQNMPKRMIDCHKLMEATYDKYGAHTRISEHDLVKKRELIKQRREERRKNTPRMQSRLKRGTVRGTIIHKAMEARRLVERAKTVRL